VLVTNAVAAVAIGCSLFMIHSLYVRFTTTTRIEAVANEPQP
jgi:hypothetical protein